MQSNTDINDVDPFVRLQGVPFILEKILFYLDYKSLSKVHQVSKLWNRTAVNIGNTWRKKLMYKVSSKNVWKEIYQQLLIGNAEDEGNNCSEKIMFGTIFKAIQKLDQNCQTDCPKLRIISLGDEDNCNRSIKYHIIEILTMDSKSLAVGSPLGLIKVFNRNDLSHEKDLDHGGNLRYLNFGNKYLISGSLTHIHLWNRETKLLMETIKLDFSVPDGSSESILFGFGEGLLVCWFTWGGIFNGGDLNLSGNILVWRLQATKSQNNEHSLVELVHQENIPLSPFLPKRSYVSKKYIVTILLRPMSSQKQNEIIIEVRSTANFIVVYSIKEVTSLSFCLRFVDDIFGIHILLKDGRAFIRLIDCNLRSYRDIFTSNRGLVILRSSSRFAVAMTFGLNKKF